MIRSALRHSKHSAKRAPRSSHPKKHARRLSALFVRASIVGFLGASLFITHLIVKADPPCDPLVDICLTNLSPSLGSTEGGASIGSNEPLDINGNPYYAPSFDPTAHTVITHKGLDLSQYQTVDYIEFTGTQYIDTGVHYLMSDSSIRMDMDATYNRITGTEQVTGFRALSGSGYVWRFFFTMYYNNITSRLYGNAGSHATTSGFNFGDITIGTHQVVGIEHDRATDTYSAYQNGAPLPVAPKVMAAPTQNIGPLYLGAARDNTSSSVNYFSDYKVYDFKISKSGSTVADYTPTWDIATQRFGMLDSVTGEFFANAGTGNIGGPPTDIHGDPLLTALPAIPSLNFTIGGQIVGTCDNVTIISTYKLTCIPSAWDDTLVGSPATSQLVDVNISLGGKSGTLVDSYTYRAPMAVADITPAVGPTTGGQSATITGTNFLPPGISSEYSSYDLVEYIEFNSSLSGTNVSSSTQYIDTGIYYRTTDTAIKMEMDMEYTNTGLEQVTGLSSTSGYGTWKFFFSLTSGVDRATAGTASSGSGLTINNPSGPIGGIPTTGAGSRRTMGMEYSRATKEYCVFLNGEPPSLNSSEQCKATATTGLGQEPTQDVGSIFIGATNDNGNPIYSSNYKLYAFKVWKDDNLIASYLPVQNTITGEYGLFDTVAHEFKWNGGGTPIAGGASTGNLGLQQILQVTIDNEICEITAVSDTAITCTTPVGTAGRKDVVVNNGLEVITLVGGYTYPPIVTGVTTPRPNGSTPPTNAGPIAGGNTITVTGIGFASGAPTVMVGAIPCDTVDVIDDETLTCVIPPALSPGGYPPGTVDVIVTVKGVDSAPNPTPAADDYIFRAPMTINAIVPSRGPISGGTEVTITGTNLLPPDSSTTGTTVIFDPTGTPATCAVITWTDTEITCTTSAHAAFGLVDVKITNNYETATVHDGYEYTLLSLALSSSSAVIILPVPGTEGFTSTTYGVKTSHTSYILSIRADDLDPGTTDDVDVKSTAACTATAKFTPISATGTLTSNSWGWKTSITAPASGQSDWLPMKTTEQTIYSGPASPTAATAHDEHTVHFGAKANYSQPACAYEGQVVVTVVATD